MKYFLLILLSLLCLSSFAQSYTLDGQILDSLTGSSLPNATLKLKGGAAYSLSKSTNSNGYFIVNGLKSGNYTLEISFLAYKKYTKVISVKKENIRLGKIFLHPEDLNIKEVDIVGQVVPVMQKGDTTEMSAQSYKVNVDADAIDLVKKMPGITVEDGKVKAHGEDLKKVLVDGKEYFGDDVLLSLQNISSDMIDKVQVYNKLSDQSEFIGFDDGNSEKVMNIITRQDRKIGKNGKLIAGYGLDDKYLFNGRLNKSTKNSNLTLLGGSNNVNQQNFSMQDMFQSMRSGGPGGGDRSAFVGISSGINTNHAYGFNYSGNWGAKLKITASYFFNQQINETSAKTSKEIFGEIDTLTQGRFIEEIQNSDQKNFNHRLNIKCEYKIDSLNSLIYRQNLSYQDKRINSDLNSSDFNQIDDPLLETLSQSTNKAIGYNYLGSLVIMHKFMKISRTFSIGLQFSGNSQDVDNTSLSNSHSIIGDTNIDQSSSSTPVGQSYSANLVYTEPISQNFLFMISYNIGINPNNSEKYVYNDAMGLHQRIDSISNVLKSDYFTQRPGLSLLIQKDKKINASVGIEFQNAELSGEQSFPESTKTNREFQNILPNAMLNYKISKKSNLRFSYRTSTKSPSILQLQPIIDISNSTNFSLGNPNLNPEYSHNIMSHFRYSNAEKFTNFGFNLFGAFTPNPICNNIQIMSKDTVIFGQHLLPNGELVNLTNLHDSWNINGFLNYGFLVKPIKCNITLMTGSGYTVTPGIVNQIAGKTESTNFMEGIVIASNISEYIDFTISYRGNYTLTRNPIDLQLNSNSWRHTVGMTSTLSTKNGIVLANSLSEQIIRGLGNGYNPDYLIWNASLGKKIFKNKKGQISIQVNDVLDQNKNVSRTVSDYYVADNSSNTIGRYALFTFTYTIRAFPNKGNHSNRFGPPDGFDGPPGGLPPGVPPHREGPSNENIN